jgi:hypothetical protein
VPVGRARRRGGPIYLNAYAERPYEHLPSN